MSDALLDAVLAVSSDHLFVFDRAGRFLSASLAGARALGRDPADLVGRTGCEIGAPSEIVAVFDAERDAVFQTGQTVRGAVRYPTARGEHDFEYSFAPILGDDGAVASVLFTGTDVEERNQRERERRQLGAALRRQALAFENMWDALIVTDMEGRITEVNEAFVTESGYSRAEALGRHISMLHLPAERDEVMPRIVEGVLRDGRWEGEIRFQRKDGREGVSLTSVVPLRDEAGAVIGTVGANRDITAQKQAQALLEKRTQETQSQRHWLEDVLNRMPTPLLLIEPGTARVTFANRAADALAGGEFPQGAPAEEYHRLYFCTDASGARIPDEQMPGVRVARGEALSGFELDWHLPQGLHSLLVDAEALPAMHGHAATCVLVFQDITELKQAQAENLGLLERGRDAAERQKGFLKDVLRSVSEGKLRLVDDPAELPARLPQVGRPLRLDTTEKLRTFRHKAQRAAEKMGLEDLRWQHLITATSEAAMNAVVHAGGGVGRVCAGGDMIQVWVEDQGRGISYDILPQATLEKGWSSGSSLGHGFWLMLNTVDRVWLMTSGAGTTVVIEQQKVEPLPDWLGDLHL